MTCMQVYSFNGSNFITAIVFFFHCLQIIDGGGFNFVVDENITQKYIATIRSSCKNGILLLS